MTYKDSFNILDLAESNELAKFFAIMRQFHGIVIGLDNSRGKEVKWPFSEKDFNPLCQVIRSSPQGKAACDATDKHYCEEVLKCKHGLSYECHAGLIDFIVPIFIDNWHIASINGGQIPAEKPSKKGFKKLCEKLKGIPVDMKKLKKSYFHSIYMSPEKINMIIELVSFFADYFCEMGRRLHPSNYRQNHPKLLKALEYIKENFRDADISLAEVASNAGLSKGYFCHRFTNIIGMPYKHYLNSLRLSEAKKLLDKTDWPITEIAFNVGFNSLPYFNQTFNKFENCSPSKYRKQHKAATKPAAEA